MDDCNLWVFFTLQKKVLSKHNTGHLGSRVYLLLIGSFNYVRELFEFDCGGSKCIICLAFIVGFISTYT